VPPAPKPTTKLAGRILDPGAEQQLAQDAARTRGLTAGAADRLLLPNGVPVTHGREPLRAGSNQALRRRQAPGEGEAPQLVEDVVEDAATLAAGPSPLPPPPGGDNRKMSETEVGFSSSYLAATASHRWAMVLMPPPPTATTAMPASAASTAYRTALTTAAAMCS
jgi:hypothetical protein